MLDMGSHAWGWLRGSASLLSVIGGLLVFILYTRLKTKLEVNKLQLEISKLQLELRRENALIYQPTISEIKEILDQTKSISTVKTYIDWGPHAELDAFGARLHHFLSVVLAYLGDAQTRTNIITARLEAAIRSWPDPYPEYDDSAEASGLPDAKSIYQRWEAVKQYATESGRVTPETAARIDFLLRLLMKRASDSRA